MLQVLAGADTRFSVSRVTALVGDASTAGVRKALNRLVRQGLVARHGDGVAYLYELNRNHLLAGPVLAVAVADDADDRWLDDLGSLREALTSWTGNDARPLVLTPDELTSEHDAVMVEIGRDALVLFGDAALLRHARRLATNADAA